MVTNCDRKTRRSYKMPDELLPGEYIRSRIYYIRGCKVLLDRDLAELYGVETKYLNRQVKRNKVRFPERFMFQLSEEEFSNLRCQNVTSSWGGIRYMPYAFTEQGVAMLSGVLSSQRAISVNIQIMDAFVSVRHYLIDKNEIEQVLKDMLDRQVSEAMDALYKMVENRAAGVVISNNSNSIISIGDITVGGNMKLSDELYDLIKRILSDLNEVDLPAKAKEIIQANRESLNILLKEDKPAKGRLKECLLTIKTALEITTIGNNAGNIIMERIHQIMKLLG